MVTISKKLDFKTHPDNVFRGLALFKVFNDLPYDSGNIHISTLSGLVF
jgi:hypothetical protein